MGCGKEIDHPVPGDGEVFDPTRGPGVPTGTVTEPGTPPSGKVLFAFKAGLDADEQIWLWLEGDRLHRVSTWPTPDRESYAVRGTMGYLEGSGRFGRLHFDHQRRFLIATERVSAETGTRPSWRLVSYELASGKATFTSPIGDTQGSLFSETRVLVSATATVVLAPVPQGADRSMSTLLEWQGGALVPATSDQPLRLRSSGGDQLVDLAGEPVLLSSQVLRRQQGRWRPVIPEEQPTRWFGHAQVAPGGDAVCLFESTRGAKLPWLLTADGTSRMLPCQGWPVGCAFSPDGSQLYLSGCAQPLVSRDGTARPAPQARLYGDARVGSGPSAVTLGVVQPDLDFERPGPPPRLVAFDWRTGTLRPRASATLRSVPGCLVEHILTPAAGTGVGVVDVSCGCIDCDDGTSFALDLESEELRQIYRLEGASFIRGSALLGSAVVTTATSGELLDGPDPGVWETLLWSDAGGTRKLGPIAGVSGVIHNPVAY
jgi:hypothetical protein